MQLRFLLIVSIIFAFTQLAFCQTKNEKEERVKFSDFPEMAQKLVEGLPKKCKRIKFYKETDGEKQSFEAKFKYKKQRYSLEFSTKGNIEDIEVVIKLKDINTSPREKINNYFKNTFTKHKIIKIQKQFVYSSKINASNFIDNVLSQNSKIPTNFEIIAEVTTEKKRNIREFTFNNVGMFLSFRVLNPTSYEHVLY